MNNYLISLLFAFTCSTVTMAQPILVDGNGQPWRVNNPEGRIDGTPMLAVDWGKGYVLLLNGKRADSIMMNFDLEYQRPMYVQNNVVYEFTDSVKECSFTYTEKGMQKNALFKSGYPAKDRHKVSTLYQVLAEGPKYVLLQYGDKKPTQRQSSFNGPVMVYYELVSELYIYDAAAQTMQKIKNKKSSVLSALPGKTEAIEKICREYSLELKTAEEIALLISKL